MPCPHRGQRDRSSVRPLRALQSLEKLVLLSVRPGDLDLAPIAAMQQLKELHLAGVPEFTLHAGQ